MSTPNEGTSKRDAEGASAPYRSAAEQAPAAQSAPSAESIPSERVRAWRRPRFWLAAAAVGASVLGVRALRTGGPIEVPPELLEMGNAFPTVSVELPVAAPLAPLLARDVPDTLAVLEPTSGSSRVLRGGTVRVRFNRLMVTRGSVNEPLAPGASPVAFDPPVEGTFRWISRSTLAFEPGPTVFDQTRESRLVFAPSLRSLAGESMEAPDDRVVVFAGGAMALPDLTPRRVLPGEPLRLAFSAMPDLAAVASQMVAYESGGAQRALRFSLASRGRDLRGNVLLDVRLNRVLEPGARVAMLLAPNLVSPFDNGEGEYGSPGPTELVVELRPRPRIEGFACSDSAESAEGCASQGAVEGIVDIEDALRLYASNALAADVTPVVRVSPALPSQRVTVRDHLLAITGEWAADQVYEVRVEGLIDSERTPLARVQPLAVRSRGRSPSVQVREGLQAFERAGAAVLPFNAVNVRDGVLRYLPLEAGRDLAFVLGQQQETMASAQSVSLAQLAPAARPNRFGPGAFRFVSSEEGRASNIAAIAFHPAGYSAESSAGGTRAVVQHTDLGVSARVLPEGVLVWVTSIATGRPVANAAVTLAWMQGTQVRTTSSASTDGEGLLWIAAPTGVTVVDVPLAVGVSANGDRAVISLDPRTSVTPSTLGLAQGAQGAGDGSPVAAVFTDRGAYRPGDKLHVKVVARQPVACDPRTRQRCNPEEVRSFARQNVRVALMDPSGESVLAERTVRTNAWGTADVSFDLPSRAMPGAWSVEVSNPRAQQRSMGRASVTVAEFRPPTMRVDLSGIAEEVVRADALSVRLESRYLFGAPAARALASWTLRNVGAAEYPMPWARTFAFAPVESAPRVSQVATGQSELAQDGTTTIATRATSPAPTRQQFEIEAEVRDASGQSTAARRTFTVYPAAYEVGVKNVPAWMGAGAELDVESIVIDHSGAPVAAQPVQARIVREGWDSYYEWVQRNDGEAAGGAYRARRNRDEREVARCAVQSEREPVHCRFRPAEAGVYRLEAKFVDANGRESIASQRTYVAAPGEHPDRDAPGAPIAVTPSARSYAVGETARIAFESPWADAEALVVVAREGSLHTERRRVRAGGNVFEFALTPQMVPNAFVHVSLVRPRTAEPAQGVDLEAPDLRLGVTEIAVRPRVSALNVSLALPGTVARPGDEVPIEVSVRNADGQGVRAEVALYVVDEGTLRLTNYETPRPGDQFFPRRAPRFVLDDVRRVLVSRLEIPALPGASGDGTDGGERAMRDERERFEPTPLWLPHLNTGVDGVARARVRLPQRPTQYRVIAVVNDGAARTGGASTQLTATMPAVLRPMVPTSAIEGDRFEASTFVYNPGTAPVDAQVRILSGDRELRSERVHIEPGGDARVSASIEIPDGAERVDLRFEATAQGVTDRRESTVVVRARGIAQRSWIAGAVTGGSRTIALSLPEGAIARDGRFTVTVAPHPFVGFEAAVDALEESPYDSLESLASRVLGLVAYASMATDPERAADARRRGERSVERLLELQDSGGQFRQWSDGEATSLYATVYALDALQSAHRAGWRVPTAARERTLNLVQQWATNGSLVDYSGGPRQDPQAYAVRVLVEEGKSHAPRLNALFEEREQLSLFGRCQLALAMPASDHRRETLVLEAARQMLDQLAGEQRPRRNDRATSVISTSSAPREQNGRDLYDSRTRTLAALVRATATVLPTTAQTRVLSSAMLALRTNGAWLSTHDNAHALLGLSAYAQRFLAREAPRARVTLDGQTVAAARGEDRRSRVFSLPVSQLVRGRHQLTIEASGEAFFALDGRWLRALSAQDHDARGRTVALHRVFERENGERVESGAHVRAGELLRVRLFVFTERGIPQSVVVRDRIGGGFDPVDRGLETTARASLDAILGGSMEDEVIDPRGFHASRSLAWLSHRTFERSEARFFTTQGPSGLLEFTYAVRATTPGQFTVLPAQIEAAQDPSFLARSSVATLVVDR